MIILAIDPGTRTGFCCDDRSGVMVFDVKRGESPGMRFLRFRAWLFEMQKLIGPIKVIAYEQAHHRGGYATECGLGFVTEIKTFAASIGAELSPVHTNTLKKWTTGHGKADKSRMIERACELSGRIIADDNEADAVNIYFRAKEEFEI